MNVLIDHNPGGQLEPDGNDDTGNDKKKITGKTYQGSNQTYPE